MTPPDKEQLLRRTLHEYADRAMDGRNVWPALRRAARGEAGLKPRRPLDATVSQALIAAGLILAVLVSTIALSALLGRPASLGSYQIAGPATPTTLNLSPTYQPGKTIAVGDMAPDATMVGVDGKPIQVGRALRGHPVWISFWATWCPPCLRQMPDIAALNQKYGSQGLIVISVDVGESPDLVQQFVRENNIRWPVAIDQDYAVSKEYEAAGVPLYLFIGSDGIVKELLYGASQQEMDAAITKILKSP